MNSQAPKIILASSSQYRRSLLAKIIKHFDFDSPDIDESAMKNESPQQLVLRLAQQKAQAVAARNSPALIIASDQLAEINNSLLGKPGNFGQAFAQLSACSGQRVEFLTSVCLLNSQTGRLQLDLDRVSVQFRTLSPAEIEAYLLRETPYDCAGSFKSEGLGIALFESVSMQDPNTLVGLPLIKLTSMLRQEGVNPLLQIDR